MCWLSPSTTWHNLNFNFRLQPAGVINWLTNAMLSWKSPTTCSLSGWGRWTIGNAVAVVPPDMASMLAIHRRDDNLLRICSQVMTVGVALGAVRIVSLRTSEQERWSRQRIHVDVRHADWERGYQTKDLCEHIYRRGGYLCLWTHWQDLAPFAATNVNTRVPRWRLMPLNWNSWFLTSTSRPFSTLWVYYLGAHRPVCGSWYRVVKNWNDEVIPRSVWGNNVVN